MNRTYHHATNDLKTNVDVSLPQLSGAAPYQLSYQIPAFLGPYAGTRRSFQTLDHGKQRLKTRLTELHIVKGTICVLCALFSKFDRFRATSQV